jgi:ABC-type transporter Mla subunit MlaD
MVNLLKSSNAAVDSVSAETATLLKNINDILSQPGVKENLAATIEALPRVVNGLSQTVEEVRPLLVKNLEELTNVVTDLREVMGQVKGQVKTLSDEKIIEALGAILGQVPHVLSSLEGLLSAQVTPALEDTRLILKETHGSIKDARDLMAKVQPVTDALLPESNSTVSKLLHEDQLLVRTEDLLSATTRLLVMLEDQPNAVIFGNRRKGKKA